MIRILISIINIVLAILVLVFCAWLDYATRTEYKKYIDGTAFYLYVLVFYILYWYVWIYTFKEIFILYIDKEERNEMLRIKSKFNKHYKGDIIRIIQNNNYQEIDERFSRETYAEYKERQQLIHECKFELYRRVLFRRANNILKMFIVAVIGLILGMCINL